MKERGLKEGMLEGIILVAKSLKLKNFKDKEISKLTGLNFNKIKNL